MSNPALENDLEVLLVLLNFSPYCIGIIPFFHGKNNFLKGFFVTYFGTGKSFNLLPKADVQDRRRKLGIIYQGSV